jgi:nucleoside-diphosphate-sugar epimerase
MRVLVTGGAGFVGGHVIGGLAALDGIDVRAAMRSRSTALGEAFDTVVGNELAPDSDWTSALSGVDVVVHLAARVHVMRERSADPLSEFRRVNVEGTRALARQAAKAGCRRFIFLSSIKVNGEETAVGRPFTEADAPRPRDPYGISKLEAETALFEVGASTGMEIVVIRPPLIYGRGVKANFAALVRAISRGTPLPFGAITRNRRSLVAVENLVDLIRVCLTHPHARGETFLVADGEDLSTAELVRRIAAALGVPSRLLPIPVTALRWAAAAVGKEAAVRRLVGSLQVDASKARSRLQWTPPLSVDEGLRRAVANQRSPLGS